AVLDPFVAVEAGLAAGHGGVEVAALGQGEVERRQVAPAAVEAGPAVALGNTAIFAAARLRPEAVQGEIGGLEAVLPLGPAFACVRRGFAEGRLPVDREDILGAAIGRLGGRGAFTGRGGRRAGAASDRHPAALRLGTGYG